MPANQRLFPPTGSYIPSDQHLVSKWLLFIRIRNSPNPRKQLRIGAQELGPLLAKWETYHMGNCAGGVCQIPGDPPVPGGYIRRFSAILPGNMASARETQRGEPHASARIRRLHGRLPGGLRGYPADGASTHPPREEQRRISLEIR